jgi:hypothetical protein
LLGGQVGDNGVKGGADAQAVVLAAVHSLKKLSKQ